MDAEQIVAGLTEAQKRAVLRMPDKAWEPKGGTSCKPVQDLVRLGILRTVDGRWLFESAKDCLCKATPLGLQVRAILQEQSK